MSCFVLSGGSCGTVITSNTAMFERINCLMCRQSLLLDWLNCCDILASFHKNWNGGINMLVGDCSVLSGGGFGAIVASGTAMFDWENFWCVGEISCLIECIPVSSQAISKKIEMEVIVCWWGIILCCQMAAAAPSLLLGTVMFEQANFWCVSEASCLIVCIAASSWVIPKVIACWQGIVLCNRTAAAVPSLLPKWPCLIEMKWEVVCMVGAIVPFSNHHVGKRCGSWVGWLAYQMGEGYGVLDWPCQQCPARDGPIVNWHRMP